MTEKNTPQEYIARNKENFLAGWFEALRIPSVSALSEHKDDMRRMAEWLRNRLSSAGLAARLVPTGGNPLVVASSPEIPGRPTILVYGHYDVQPVDPLDQWKSEPFEPTIRGGNVFCRGADDDKGQSLAHLFAAESILAARGELPVCLKFVYEGEEEIGSMSLESYLQSEEGRATLAADAILVSDTDMAGPDTPAITNGLRGILGCEIKLTGPSHDLHSGLYGGSVLNPAVALCALLGKLIDRNGKIQVPGFYDDVVALTEADREAFAMRPFDEKSAYAEIGLKQSFGEPQFTVLERRGARPTFDINGLTSGYQGEGGKTIIPSTASAKLTFRMVPNQKPDQLFENLRAFLAEQLWPGVEMSITGSQMSSGFLVPLDSPYIQAAARGIERVFGKAPLFIRDGGSIPVVSALASALKADVVLAGFGVEEDAIHSPNEHYALESFYRGIEASVAILEELGAMKDER
ncbi:MAG: dipeptidase [Thermoguttaceae bacterium]|nr:dipeptidase [Thermoguttaceae bacterium]